MCGGNMNNFILPLVLISLGHFFIDFYGNILPGLMPAITKNLGLSMTLSGLLFTMLSITSSWLQPFFGYLGGRFRAPLVLAISVMISAVFMAMVGVANSYIFLLVMVTLAGIGSSLYHPIGSVSIATLSTKNQGFIMALYITAGTVGMTLAPISATLSKNAFGFKGLLLLGLPGITAGIIMLIYKNQLSSPGSLKISPGRRSSLFHTHFKYLVLMVIVVGFRTWVLSTFTIYTTMFYVSRGLSEAASSGILSLFLLFQSIGGIAGGFVSDRIGVKKTLIYSALVSIICLVVFFNIQGPVSIACLLLSGALIQSAFPGSVVLAQRLYPQNPSIATGFMQGFTFGMGGLGGLFTGVLSDALGGNLFIAMMSTIAFLGVSLAGSLMVPMTGENQTKGIEEIGVN
ncbi:MFS transporter [Thermoanaerobacteraceae bacterium SP2]|jgi:FSR family fosmidomycin resistance protein-like MFS transporter|nr:MFS transporter [Thermoanaerobacteraceae bacterium SP2]